MHERAVDNAITPRCPACKAPLPRIVYIPGGAENSLGVSCPACRMIVTFRGEGLILDRRQRAGGPSSAAR
jgi:hypothetical protein